MDNVTPLLRGKKPSVPVSEQTPSVAFQADATQNTIVDAYCIIQQTRAIVDMLTSAIAEAGKDEVMSISVNDRTLLNSLFAVDTLLATAYQRMATAEEQAICVRKKLEAQEMSHA